MTFLPSTLGAAASRSVEFTDVMGRYHSLVTTESVESE